MSLAKTAAKAQWPILLVGLIFATAFVLVGANFWRRGSLLIGIGVGVAAVLRFRGLGDQSFWYDEWVTTEGTDNNLVPHLLQQIATREGAGPPYFVLMWFWARLVGDGDAALRSFSALAGLATVPVAHALAVHIQLVQPQPDDGRRGPRHGLRGLELLAEIAGRQPGVGRLIVPRKSAV